MVALNSFLISVFVLAGAAFAAPTNDKTLMEKARNLYAQGELQKAVEIYSQVPASSDFWLDALEEKAWAATRQGNYENALADLHSITSAVWSSQVGPETYMLSTFVSLKICAYKDVVKKINLFKKRILPRVDALQSIVDNQLPAEFWEMKKAILKEKVGMASLGKIAEKYPRYFYRDVELIKALESQSNAKVEARMKQLAQADLDEIEVNLKKMKVIEVELIQKVLMADDLSKSKSKNLKFNTFDRNQQLVFPVTDEEVWVDEVGHFEVKADKCPFSGNKGSSL